MTEDERTAWRLRMRDEVWQLQESLRGITGDQAVRGCNHAPVEGAATLMGGQGSAYYGGLATCGKIHLCPVCSGRIRAGRSDEMESYVRAWQDAGHGVAMITLTMRHYDRHTLEDLVRIQTEAWARACGHRAGKMWQRLRATLGIAGYARSWETTHGDHGWHPHWHILLWTETPWTEAEAADFSAAMLDRWSRALSAAGGYLPNSYGVRVDVPGAAAAPLGEMRDAVRMARYLVKTDHGAGWSLGAEMTRSDVKSGGRGGRTPFEILAHTADQERTEDQRAADVGLWREYETGVHGVRALVWSRGMRDRLRDLAPDVDDLTDAELASPEESGAEPIAVIPSATWYAHVIRYAGRKLELVQAAERNGLSAVKRLIESWGLVWGVDVLDPPTVVDAPDAVAENRVRAGRTAGVVRPRIGPDAGRVLKPVKTVDAPVRPVQERLEAPEMEPVRMGVDELAEIRARMVAANRANNGAAGIERMRERGGLALLVDEPPNDDAVR